MRSSKREIDGRASIHKSFGPHGAAVAVDDSLHGGKSNAAAGELVVRVQADLHINDFSKPVANRWGCGET